MNTSNITKINIISIITTLVFSNPVFCKQIIFNVGNQKMSTKYDDKYWKKLPKYLMSDMAFFGAKKKGIMPIIRIHGPKINKILDPKELKKNKQATINKQKQIVKKITNGKAKVIKVIPYGFKKLNKINTHYSSIKYKVNKDIYNQHTYVFNCNKELVLMYSILTDNQLRDKKKS